MLERGGGIFQELGPSRKVLSYLRNTLAGWSIALSFFSSISDHPEVTRFPLTYTVTVRDCVATGSKKRNDDQEQEHMKTMSEINFPYSKLILSQ